MKLLGTIKKLQIQRDQLKVGQAPNRVYTTTPLLTVTCIKPTLRGVFGYTDMDNVLVDVHHLDHPHSRNRGNENGLSINFTGHYDRIRQRFGPHMTDGVAGENILVDNAEHITLEELGQRFAIESAVTGQVIYLENTRPAVPCVEFATFTAQGPLSGESMKDALQFLDDGMRGFYTSLAQNQKDPIIQTGDRVFALMA